ncbi:MAG: glycosyltransferase family protein [Acidiphilium sp.]
MLADSAGEAERLAHITANKVSRNAIIGRILHARPPHVQGKDWVGQEKFSRITAADLFNALAHRSAYSDAGLAIAISHDHYVSTAGGVQNCVGLEEDAFRRRLWIFLHLCPNLPLPTLAGHVSSTEFDLVASIDGNTLGVLPVSDIIQVLCQLRVTKPIWVIIHQLLGHSPELIKTMINMVRPTIVYFWIHDLFAHCPSVNLLRNEATFCGGPPVFSGACGICHAGPERAEHVERMQRFFSAIRPTLLSPSQTILDFWRNLHDFAHDTAYVLPPCSLNADPHTVIHEINSPLRVAFLGFSAFHKGWETFKSLALWFGTDPRYRFYRLGMEGENVPGILHHSVEVTSKTPLAMVNAIAECHIDVVLNWSLCYESFSFTTIEALASGAFVVARRGAGNVFPLIESIGDGCGIQVPTEVELQALFFSGHVIKLVQQAPRRTGRLEMGVGAAALVPSESQ